MDFLIFVTSNLKTRYWCRTQKLWTESPSIAHGYKTMAATQAQLTRIVKRNPATPFKLPEGETLRSYGARQRSSI